MGSFPEVSTSHMQSPEQGSPEPSLSGDALLLQQQEQIAKLQKLQQEMALQSQQGNHQQLPPPTQEAIGAPSNSLPVPTSEVVPSSNGLQLPDQKIASSELPNGPVSTSNPPFLSDGGQPPHQQRVSFHAGVRAPAPIGPLNMTSSMSSIQQLSNNGSISSNADGSSMTSEASVGDSEQKWQTDNDLPHRREFIRLIAQLLTERKHNPSQKWLLELPYKARKLEEQLYRTAPSFESYIDKTTLKQRLKKVATAITFKFRDAKRKSLTRRSSSITSSVSDWSISSPSSSPSPQVPNNGEALMAPSSLSDADSGGNQAVVDSTSDELQRTQALSQSLQEKIMANIAAQKQLMMSLGIGGMVGQQQQNNINGNGNNQAFVQDQFGPFLPVNNGGNNPLTMGLQNMVGDGSTNTTNILALSSQQQEGFGDSFQLTGQRSSFTQQQSAQGLPAGDWSAMQPQSSAKIEPEPISHAQNGGNDANGDDNPPMTPETFGW